jgi:hypothetical protein
MTFGIFNVFVMWVGMVVAGAAKAKYGVEAWDVGE